MRYEFLLGAAALALGSFMGGEVVQAEGFQWTEPKMGTYAIEGVCSITPSEVSCWEASGKPSGSLTDRVRDQLKAKSILIPNQVGKKNRTLVTKWIPRSEGVFASVRVPGSPMNDAGNLSFISVPADQGSVSVDVLLQGTDEDNALSFVPKKGGAGTTQGRTVKVLNIVKTKDARHIGVMRSGKDDLTWRLYIESSSPLQGYRVQSFGPDGKVISAVGPKGNILTMPAKVTDKPVSAFTMLVRDIQGKETWIDTNIDPGKIKFIKLVPAKSTTVVFKDLAMDPKP